MYIILYDSMKMSFKHFLKSYVAWWRIYLSSINKRGVIFSHSYFLYNTPIGIALFPHHFPPTKKQKQTGFVDAGLFFSHTFWTKVIWISYVGKMWCQHTSINHMYYSDIRNTVHHIIYTNNILYVIHLSEDHVRHFAQ